MVTYDQEEEDNNTLQKLQQVIAFFDILWIPELVSHWVKGLEYFTNARCQKIVGEILDKPQCPSVMEIIIV